MASGQEHGSHPTNSGNSIGYSGAENPSSLPMSYSCDDAGEAHALHVCVVGMNSTTCHLSIYHSHCAQPMVLDDKRPPYVCALYHAVPVSVITLHSALFLIRY